MKDRTYTRRDFVSASVLAGLAVFGGALLTACADGTPATPGAGSGSTGTPVTPVTPVKPGTPVTTGTPTPTPPTPPTGTGNSQPNSGDAFLDKARLPVYPGLVGRDEFSWPWPGIERYKIVATTALWGYYRSNDPAATIEGFYREQVKNAPYKKRELFFFDRGGEGLMTMLFDDDTKTWIRIWAIPEPSDSSKTNVVFAVDSMYHFCSG